mmetsp:Transcript_3754/g.7859  ORF Transcript_3754/g.7859 Transcript_3754/m.7859 type:complete len:133 (-) Transcript_3754:70-468(-)
MQKHGHTQCDHNCPNQYHADVEPAAVPEKRFHVGTLDAMDMLFATFIFKGRAATRGRGPVAIKGSVGGCGRGIVAEFEGTRNQGGEFVRTVGRHSAYFHHPFQDESIEICRFSGAGKRTAFFLIGSTRFSIS